MLTPSKFLAIATFIEQSTGLYAGSFRSASGKLYTVSHVGDGVYQVDGEGFSASPLGIASWLCSHDVVDPRGST